VAMIIDVQALSRASRPNNKFDPGARSAELTQETT